MKKYNFLLILVTIATFTSCGSIKSSLTNLDHNAIKPQIKNNQFVLTEYASDGKYGYDKDYPINLGFENEKYSSKNVALFFNALAGPKGEKISYDKVDTCCPFPTKKSVMGAGTLDIYNVIFEGSDKKIVLYINIYERGKVLCPKGFSIKK
jgi:hypothetical protein